MDKHHSQAKLVNFPAENCLLGCSLSSEVELIEKMCFSPIYGVDEKIGDILERGLERARD